MHTIEKIDKLIRRGEALAAYDLAAEALQGGSLEKEETLALKHLATLSLVRSGADEQARLEYHRLGLDSITDQEDILALGGRLLKDATLEASGKRRRTLAKRAADKYAQAYQRTGGYYSAINRATLSLLAGDKKQAITLAKEILASLSKKHKDRRGETGYYLAATRAEAHLLLGNQIKAEEAFATAITLDPGNLAARATTLHQLGVILGELEQDKEWLDSYRPPKVAHFAGHMFAIGHEDGAFDNQTIGQMRRQIDAGLEKQGIGFGYGALAAGSDILIAESLLARDGELHLVLPVPEEAFVRTSVAPYGDAWIKRFETCRAKATSVHFATDNLDYLDHSVISFANQIAMGLSVLKASALATEAVQFLVWDGRKDRTNGTSHAANLWRETGRKQLSLPFPGSARAKTSKPSGSRIASKNVKERRLMAMLFADVRGYGTLSEGQIPVFIDSVLSRLAACCEEMKPAPAFRNTWGDGLFLAFEDIAVAARMAVRLQQSFRVIDLKKLKLPGHLTLRIGGHYGPVYEGKDPHLKQANIFGTEITFAARIEPATPPGSIFVSEHFASILAASHADHFHCDYVGQNSLTKDGPKVPLFSLRAREEKKE